MSEPPPPCKPTAAPPVQRPAALLLLDPATPSGAALRTTVAAVIAMALAFALHLEVPALAVVFVLARGSAGAITMVLGSVVGSAAAIALLALFDQSSVAFSATLLCLTTLATYVALGHRFPYAGVQALLSGLILVGQGLDAPDGAERHAFYDLANVVVAAFAAFVAGASQPVAVPGQLQDTLATSVRSSAALLGGAGASAVATLALRLELLSRRRHALLAASWPTRLVSRARRRALHAAVAAADDVTRHMLAIEAAVRVAPRAPGPETGRALAELRDATSSVASFLAARHGAPDDRELLRSGARERARELRRTTLAAYQGAPLLAALETSTRRVLAQLALLAPLLHAGRNDPAPGTASIATQPRVRPSLDRFRLRHAVKSGASYLVILWAWVVSDWGAIVPALVVAVLVATLATPLGATLTKAALRISGVLVGGIAGLLFAVLLLPFITSLPAICGVSGVILFACLWVLQHHERLAFASLQAAIAFTLTLVHGAGPSPTWREPLESLIGLAFGISVVVVVMHSVWPLDAAESAHRVLAELLHHVGRRFARALAASPQSADPRIARARGRETAAAAAARAYAAGFTHEVELYGAQFGRPHEHLCELLHLVVELEAVVSLLEDVPRPAASDGTAATAREALQVGALIARECAALATAMAALPGEGASADDGLSHQELAARSAALVASAELRVPALATAARLASVAVAVLDELRRQLQSPAHTERRRAA